MLPDLVERGAEQVLLDVGPLGGGQRLQAGVGAVQLVELGGAHGEHGAALEHLHLDAHLEHVGGGGHDRVGLLGLGQHLAHRVGAAGLDARLVDGAGQHVGRAHREGGGGRGRRGDAAGGADAQRLVVTVLCLQAIAQGDQGRQQRDGGAIVGVAAGVGLGGHVLGDGNARGEARPAPG